MFRETRILYSQKGTTGVCVYSESERFWFSLERNKQDVDVSRYVRIACILICICIEYTQKMLHPVKKHQQELLLHFTFILDVYKFCVDYKLMNLNNDDTFLALNPKIRTLFSDICGVLWSKIKTIEWIPECILYTQLALFPTKNLALEAFRSLF
ncbi:hypothetical protein WN51_02472 [Melipona quadrifasciata]|uniref:Uncharacterized protein n=1 Tax=Melipona quadrifasciata TaxID=166423 RepID=A0A0N1ITB5_9HYME|nr:hypothetical protein WN51_02472 [Melipona quadrifasciata]